MHKGFAEKVQFHGAGAVFGGLVQQTAVQPHIHQAQPVGRPAPVSPFYIDGAGTHDAFEVAEIGGFDVQVKRE